MPGQYGQEFNKATTSTTVGVGALATSTANMRRFGIIEITFGSEATPANQVFLFEVNRSTTLPTGTSVTPNALDPADPATTAQALENLTVQGTNTAGAVPYSLPLNQTNSFRWVARPGSELIIPATSDNGFHFNTPTCSGTPAASLAVIFQQF